MKSTRLRWMVAILLIIAIAGTGLAILLRRHSPPGPRISEEDLARAAGLALVRVTSIKRVENKAVSPGYVADRVELEIIRSSGTVMDLFSIIISREEGMLPQPRPDAPPPVEQICPVSPGDLIVGERYWMAFASSMDRERYPQGVIAWQPEAGGKALLKMVRENRYRWRPQFSPATGLTLEHLCEPDGSRWTVRVVGEGEVLWSEALPGTPADRNYNPWLYTASQMPPPLGDMLPADSVILVTRARCELPADPEASLPAGEYFVEEHRDAHNGRVLVRKVFKAQVSRVEYNSRLYDPATGRLIELTIYQWLETGGKDVGADTDAWYRREIRRYDGVTGDHTSTKVYRYNTSQDAYERWLEITE